MMQRQVSIYLYPRNKRSEIFLDVGHLPIDLDLQLYFLSKI